MRLKYALRDIIMEIDTATIDDVDVRTSGGDFDIDPPEVIIEWRASALDTYNGANSFGGHTTDSDTGYQDGREFHLYYFVEADCLIRSHKEAETHDIAATIKNTFLPYTYNASNFDDDTAEWEVGDLSPRNNPVVEPDWYENGIVLTFTLLETSTETAEAIETINEEDTDDYIDLTLEDGDVSIG